MRKRHVQVYLDQPLAEALWTRASANGTSISAEASRAIRDHLVHEAARSQDTLAAPVINKLLVERLGQVETWLRPMVAATSIHAATAMLLALEVLCGTRVEPGRARETLDLIRGRAYKMIRRRDDPGGQG